MRHESYPLCQDELKLPVAEHCRVTIEEHHCASYHFFISLSLSLCVCVCVCVSPVSKIVNNSSVPNNEKYLKMMRVYDLFLTLSPLSPLSPAASLSLSFSLSLSLRLSEYGFGAPCNVSLYHITTKDSRRLSPPNAQE